jgi:hypothetical protein
MNRTTSCCRRDHLPQSSSASLLTAAEAGRQSGEWRQRAELLLRDAAALIERCVPAAATTAPQCWRMSCNARSQSTSGLRSPLLTRGNDLVGEGLPNAVIAITDPQGMQETSRARPRIRLVSSSRSPCRNGVIGIVRTRCRQAEAQTGLSVSGVPLSQYPIMVNGTAEVETQQENSDSLPELHPLSTVVIMSDSPLNGGGVEHAAQNVMPPVPGRHGRDRACAIKG